jgi:ribosomal protein L37AE/L43A
MGILAQFNASTLKASFVAANNNAQVESIVCGFCDYTPKRISVTTTGITVCTSCFATAAGGSAKFTLTGESLNATKTLFNWTVGQCGWHYLSAANAIKREIWNAPNTTCSGPADSTVQDKLEWRLSLNAADDLDFRIRFENSLYFGFVDTAIVPDSDCVTVTTPMTNEKNACDIFTFGYGGTATITEL